MFVLSRQDAHVELGGQLVFFVSKLRRLFDTNNLVTDPSNTPGIINGWFTYKPPMKRREHDLNQTSRELCSSRSFLRGLPYSVASYLLKFFRPELKPEELQLAKGAFAMMKLNLPEACLSCLYFEDGSKIVPLTKRNVVNVMASMPFYVLDVAGTVDGGR